MSHLDSVFSREVGASYLRLFEELKRLQDRVTPTVGKLKNKKAKDFCLYGIGRRNVYIQDCVKVFFEAFEHEVIDKKIPTSLRTKETIHLNMFLFALTGGFDNLAWTIVKERNIKIHHRDTTIWNKEIQKHLPPSLQAKVKKFASWHKEHLSVFRDASAHRIMPYVLPYLETDKKRNYESMYIQDFDSQKLMRLHPQVIADTRVYMEIMTTGLADF